MKQNSKDNLNISALIDNAWDALKIHDFRTVSHITKFIIEKFRDKAIKEQDEIFRNQKFPDYSYF